MIHHVVKSFLSTPRGENMDVTYRDFSKIAFRCRFMMKMIFVSFHDLSLNIQRIVVKMREITTSRLRLTSHRTDSKWWYIQRQPQKNIDFFK